MRRSLSAILGAGTGEIALGVQDMGILEHENDRNYTYAHERQGFLTTHDIAEPQVSPTSPANACNTARTQEETGKLTRNTTEPC